MRDGIRAIERTEGDRDLLASIVECSEDAILSALLDGTITSWNPAAERLFGYTKEEILEQNVSILEAPGRLGELSRLFHSLREERTPEPFENFIVNKDGNPIHVSGRVSAIRDPAGQITGAALFFQ